MEQLLTGAQHTQTLIWLHLWHEQLLISTQNMCMVKRDLNALGLLNALEKLFKTFSVA